MGEAWATRVCLRLWRELAIAEWARDQFEVDAAVSYADATRHAGDIYRFDGWRRFGLARGRTAVGGRQAGAVCSDKHLWVWDVKRGIGKGGNAPLP